MRVLQVVPGNAPLRDHRDNIFIHRQVNSLEHWVGEMQIIYAGLGSRLTDMFALYRRLHSAIVDFQPHVIHAQYATAIGAVTILGSGCIPTIVSFGGDEIYGTYVNKNSIFSPRTLLARWLSVYCARHATVSLVKNDQMRKVVQGWGAKDVSDIPNGVNLNTFLPLDQQTCRQKLGLDSNKLYVMFVVRGNDLVKRRDLAEKAIQIYNQENSSPAELLVVENVHPNVIPLYLNAVNVLLLCSNHEGSPNIIKEALACNRPVICTDVGDIRQRFRDIQGLFIVPQDALLLAQRLADAVQIDHSNGRDFIVSFAEENIAQQLYKLYLHTSQEKNCL